LSAHFPEAEGRLRLSAGSAAGAWFTVVTGNWIDVRLDALIGKPEYFLRSHKILI